jgi:hypothetical protein
MSEHQRPLPLFDQPPEEVFEGPAALHREPEPTEIEAAAKVGRSAARLRQKVYEAVRASEDGLAGWEVCAMFPDINPYSLRPRLTELGQRGLLFKRGTRRNPSGNNEMIWRAT